ncbi:CBS domain-containing protein [Desulforamulus hydrothermalis]|uniref:CBS domain containing membrane protein n=1 Tax=Desulforamulus hydrothermalis Lam5 = DSM 18033 TaxID=1121428 RepID=K8E177_9FIRM|nr:CBS domain-containing protein [Desulforamulus hydrothermalis]CCO09464.1 CBS domain containing membrane protein [Desulforamulus hydrothermalis Lam5 = DSM 18033]SHH07648.1 CBS domain-containing protein [Desulforamulus hydrothermalis Lam5 = DSM 18033]
MPGPKEKKVKHIMLPIQDYATVFLENSLRDAMFVLKCTFFAGCSAGSQAHRSVLVFDHNKKLVGTLSFRDIINSLKISRKALSEGFKYREGVFTSLCLLQAAKKVKEVMKPIGKVTVNVNDNILDAICLLMEENLELIPVEDKGQIVGMVRTVEIFKEVSELVEANGFS